MCPGRSSTKALHVLGLVAVLLLSPWPDQTVPFLENHKDATSQLYDDHHAAVGQRPASAGRSRLASAQGLSVPDESLGAGELATLDQFSQLERLLELSDQFTGGKGRGGKSTGGRRGAAFDDAQSWRQQQLELYHVAGMQ